jgi:hypothetical protein
MTQVKLPLEFVYLNAGLLFRNARATGKSLRPANSIRFFVVFRGRRANAEFVPKMHVAPHASLPSSLPSALPCFVSVVVKLYFSRCVSDINKQLPGSGEMN